MIKLIASDMDGTLLDDKKRLNPQMYSVIQSLGEKGIAYVAASGRQFCSLERFFAPIKDDIYYIAENGAFVYHQGKEVYSSVMEPALIRRILDYVQKEKGQDGMLCGKYCGYSDNHTMVKVMRQEMFQYNMEYVPDMYEVREDIIKISILDNGNLEESIADLKRRFGHETDIAASGYNCIDFTNKNVNKGYALQMIQKSLGVAPEHTMVFGDNYNDVDMFDMADYSYAMNNASEGVKKRAKFIGGSNNEDFVMKEIIKRCLPDFTEHSAGTFEERT